MLVSDIVAKYGGRIFGKAGREIKRPSVIQNASAGDITFLANPLYRRFLNSLKGAVIVLSKDDFFEELAGENTVIVADDPYVYFGTVLGEFDKKEKPCGISGEASVSPSAALAGGVYVGPFAVIGDGAELKNGAVVHGNVHIAARAVIGAGTEIFPGCYIGERVRIGRSCIIDSGVKIGTRGFGFPRNAKGTIDIIPQIGSVEIGDEVYIGANSTIDRGTIGDTKIGSGTKIDNLVQIAHNVEIGEYCLIISQSGIAGSTKIGDRVTIAAQAGIIGHLEIGSDAIITAQSGVTKNVPSGKIYSGSPARPRDDELRKLAVIGRLPEIYKKLKEIEKNGKA